MSDGANIPHLVKMDKDNWVQPANVTRVHDDHAFVHVYLVDGGRVSVSKHSGSLLYRDAEAVVSAINLEIGVANGERGR